MQNKRISINEIAVRKSTGEKLVCLTAYTAPVAAILDRHVDIILVGDTLGMLIYGMSSTLDVTVAMMINHGKAVVNASKRAFVVVDLPFASFQESKEQAFRNASKIMAKTGCQAVKLEGGSEMAETVQFLSMRGIPVMGHVGMLPQSVNIYGGYRAQGNSVAAEKKILQDAVAIEKAGAFSVVVECVKEKLAEKISNKLSIPVIGIGASVNCDGQVLVTEDMAGLFNDFTPKFVKKFGDLAKNLDDAVVSYKNAVRDGSFPTKNNIY